MMTPLPPAFWTWARWRLGHGEFKPYGPRSRAHRPNVPWAIPPRWWREYRRRFEPPPPKPPPPPSPGPPPSVFAGIGMFTGWEPRIALRLGGLGIRWIAVQAEGRHDDGRPWATPEVVAELRAAGFDVHVWEAVAREGGAAVRRLGGTGYIGQAESGAQFLDVMSLPPTNCPKAIVSNVTHLADRSDAWPNDWVCIPEAYANANPRATVSNMHYEAHKRGAKEIFPCFGLYDASAEQPGVGRKIPLRAYLDAYRPLGLRGWNGYMAEHIAFDDDAIAALAGR